MLNDFETSPEHFVSDLFIQVRFALLSIERDTTNATLCTAFSLRTRRDAARAAERRHCSSRCNPRYDLSTVANASRVAAASLADDRRRMARSVAQRRARSALDRRSRFDRGVGRDRLSTLTALVDATGEPSRALARSQQRAERQRLRAQVAPSRLSIVVSTSFVSVFAFIVLLLFSARPSASAAWRSRPTRWRRRSRRTRPRRSPLLVPSLRFVFVDSSSEKHLFQRF